MVMHRRQGSFPYALAFTCTDSQGVSDVSHTTSELRELR